MARKTVHGFDWEQGYYKKRTLSRSFDKLEEANKFAEGKTVTDIYRANGRYRVEYIKIVKNNG